MKREFNKLSLTYKLGLLTLLLSIMSVVFFLACQEPTDSTSEALRRRPDAGKDAQVIDASGNQDASVDASFPDATFPDASIPPPPPNQGQTFNEPFNWLGNHGDVLPASRGGGTTVWWNNDSWDCRQDTDFNTVGNGGNHIDIHKAASGISTDATEDNSLMLFGGNGSPGVATMHLNMETIISARLRNPMMISETSPGIVTFYAQRFVSDGHWWEVGIQPIDKGVHGVEYSPVPTPLTDGTAGPRAGDSMPGPGHRPSADGLNFVTGGFDDCPAQGKWYFFHSVKKSVNGVTSDYYNPATTLSNVGFSSPSEENQLYQWQLVFRPSGIDLFADFERDGVLKFKQHFGLAIPWPEVYVSLMGVAYQANHHPANIGCGLEAFGSTPELAKIRELHWKNFSASPMKYARTSVAPRDVVLGNEYQRLGWQLYDLRDTQRFGPTVNGVPRPNLTTYDDYSGLSYLYTSFDTGFGFAGGRPPVASFTLPVDLSTDQVNSALTNFIYDIRTPNGSTGSAVLYVNNNLVGVLPSDEPGSAAGSIGPSWKHRSVIVSNSYLLVGNNTLKVVFSGKVQMDRMQLEFFHNQ